MQLGRGANSDLIERLKALRQEARLTQADIAKLLGISPAAVGQWETGVTSPKREHIKALARTLGTTASWLEEGIGPRAPTEDQPMDDEATQVDPRGLPPEISAGILGMLRGKHTELWQLNSDILAGAGYQRGDYLVVDTSQAPKARDIVLILQVKRALVRLLFPPYGFAVAVGRPPEPVLIDNVRTTVKGVIMARFAYSS